MDNLNWVDYVFVVIFALSALVGFKRGIIKEALSLATIIAAIIIASLFADRLATTFMTYPATQRFIAWASSFIGMDTTQLVSYFSLLMSFSILFVAVFIVGAFATRLISMGFDVGIISLGNHILGAGFGLVRGFLLVLVTMFLIQLTPLGKQEWWLQSQFVNRFQPYVSALINFVSPAIAAIESKTKVGETIKETGQKIQQLIQ